MNGLIKATPILFVLLWSSAFIGAKFGLPFTDPLTFMFLRFGTVVAIFALLSLLFRATWPRKPSDFGHIALVGFLVQTLYLSGTFIALDRGVSVGLVALILGLQPLLTAIFLNSVSTHKILNQQWIGITLGFGGLVFIVWDQLKANDVDPLGIILVSFGVCSITLGTLYQRHFCRNMNLLTGNTIQAAVAMVLTGIGAWLFEELRVDWNLKFLGALIWMIFIVSLGAHTLLLFMLKQNRASNVAALFYLTPPTAAIMAYFMFGEVLAISSIFGMLVTVIGVALVIQRNID